jgi:hypothetical protein
MLGLYAHAHWMSVTGSSKALPALYTAAAAAARVQMPCKATHGMPHQSAATQTVADSVMSCRPS